MNGQNKKMELLGSVPVSKALLALGLPTMIGMMMNALYNLADAYFVGGLGTCQNNHVRSHSRGCYKCGAGPCLYLCSGPGGSRRRNRYGHFPAYIHIGLFILYFQ